MAVSTGSFGVEQAVAVAQRRRTASSTSPAAALRTRCRHVRLGDHADERVDLVDGCRRSPSAGPRPSCAGRRRRRRRRLPAGDRVAVAVGRLDEVEDVRIVDRIARVDQRIGGEPFGRFAGDRRERRPRRQPVRAGACRCRSASRGRGRAGCRSRRDRRRPRSSPGRSPAPRTRRDRGCPASAPGTARCAASCRSARRSCTAARLRGSSASPRGRSARAGRDCRTRRRAESSA